MSIPWESDNKQVAALVCVLRFGSSAIHYIATGLLTKFPVQILLTTVLAGSKVFLATQAG
jgi:hypothetical protein